MTVYQKPAFVYKVVDLLLDEEDNLRFFSAGLWQSQKYTLEYFTDRFVTPLIGRIFCFVDLPSAQKWVDLGGGRLSIWKADFSGYFRPAPIMASCTDRDIERFWRQFVSQHSFARISRRLQEQPPLGTAWVGSLRLAEEVVKSRLVPRQFLSYYWQRRNQENVT